MCKCPPCASLTIQFLHRTIFFLTLLISSSCSFGNASFRSPSIFRLSIYLSIHLVVFRQVPICLILSLPTQVTSFHPSIHPSIHPPP
ncbi:hypothetical protein F4815DRAFT_469261 [Daldinia loculata]|nr:hypothetical protein F4815DRAFT_469261 [Daldinia loculata]